MLKAGNLMGQALDAIRACKTLSRAHENAWRVDALESACKAHLFKSRTTENIIVTAEEDITRTASNSSVCNDHKALFFSVDMSDISFAY